MIEPRIYRAAFVPALLAIVLVMFSLESRPKPLPQGLAADVVFDGDQAATTTRAVLDAGRDRRAGSAGDLAAAEVVGRGFAARGFTTRIDRFDDEGKELANVVGRRAGKSRRQLLVVAARDARGVPDAAGSAADTAALLEIARVFEGRPSQKTLALASVDGSALGELGTARLAMKLGDPELVDGAIVISGFGSRTSKPATIEAWAGNTNRAGIGLTRTVAESLREEQGLAPEGAGPAGQLARMAFPVGVGPQGVLLREGFDTVRIAGDGELPDGGESAIGSLDARRFERLGRATLRTLTALDAGPRPTRGPESYVTSVSQVIPGWVLSVLAFTLILPALVASVDAFARARRRREPIGAWLTWFGAGVLPFVIGLALVHGLALVGAIDAPPDSPVAPDLYPLDASGAAVLAGAVVVVALSWFALRHLVRRADPRLRELSTAPGAAVVVALALSGSVLVLWVVNAYSALVLVPALHLWLLGILFDPPPPRRARMIMVLGGLLAPALLVFYDLVVLSLDPVSGAWYALLLVTGGHVSVASAIVACVLAAVLCYTVAITRARPALPPSGLRSDTPSVRGPASYAGPGSLGGTSSALPPR